MQRIHPVYQYENDILSCDGVDLRPVAAEFGTPLFVYSGEALRRNFRRLAEAFADVETLVAYSVKANSNGAILRLLAAEGAGFDIVSGNELRRVLDAGIGADRVIFAGVGKTDEEMRFALEAGVREFNVESPSEAVRLNEVALAAGKIAPIAIRVNPNVDAQTHKHITTGKRENKFGMSFRAAETLAAQIRELKGLRIDGIHAHIGSQILKSEPHREAAEVLDTFLGNMKAAGHDLKTLNFGGGFGISYQDGQEPIDMSVVADVVKELVKKHGLQLILEPGRSIVGPAGALLTRVLFIKHGDVRTFVIIDGAMTEVIRPALYSAHHDIVPVERGKGGMVQADIVGPVCETGDFLGQERDIALPEPGALLAVLDAGAYCSVMSSQYNSRQRAAEVLIDGGQAHVIRERESYDDLIRHEKMPAHLIAKA